MTDARNFLINSDYPMDKVVYLKTGSVPIDGYPHTIAHGLPFTPLMGGCWSLTPDFTTTYEFYSGDFPSGVPTRLFAHELRIFSNNTDIQIDTIDTKGDSATAYYRIYGLEPSDSNADLVSPLSSSDSFILNSDYNYMKLYEEGVVNPGLATAYSIPHGLGYKPQVHAWYTYAGDCYPFIAADADISEYRTLQVYSTEITVTKPSWQDFTRVDYRIYFDD